MKKAVYRSLDKTVDEYCGILRRHLLDGASRAGGMACCVENLLVKEADWTPEAAVHLHNLARDYGSFMLRSALALSIALDIEDGRLGF